MGHAFIENYLLFIWNSDLTGSLYLCKGQASYDTIHILQVRVRSLKGVKSKVRPQKGLESLTLNVDYSRTH